MAENNIITNNESTKPLSGFEQITKAYGPDFFGKLTPFIKDIDITDINCNGKDVWLNHIKNGRYKVDNINFTDEDIEKLAYKISNTENVQFNVSYPILQADLLDLRFHFTHKSFSVSGTTCSIRKTPIIARIKEKDFADGDVKYLTDKANQLLKRCVKSRLNTVVCGLTGSGKTEFVKYLMQFTKPYERIITIEDTSELHLRDIYPDKDVVELKVNHFVDYDGAIKSCMRMLPVWVNLSEARGKEVKELIKCISTGAKIITTIHCDNAKQIPLRILNMFEDNELSNDKVKTMIYDYIDLGIHIKAEFEGKTVRYVDQIIYYENNEVEGNKSYEIYKVSKNLDGTYRYKFNDNVPDTFLDKIGFSREDFHKFWIENNDDYVDYSNQNNTVDEEQVVNK